MKKRFSGISAGIILSICLGFLLAVYAPLELYIPNQNEFWPTIDLLIGPIVFLFCTITILGCMLFIVLRLLGKVPYYIALLLGFAALVSLYIQGNFLISGLPPFDGTIYDWSAASPERIKSIVAWIVPALVLVAVLLKFKFPLFRKVVFYGSGALLLILVLTLSTLLFSAQFKEKGGYLTNTDTNILQLSNNTNMVVIVMDALDSTCFLQAIEENPEFSDSFDDFTYYSDALAAYPFTMHSIPMILTGQWHENAEPFNEYAENAYSSSPLLKKLEQQNYKMGIYANVNNMFTTRSFENRFENQLSASPVFRSSLDACKQLVKMAGIKYAPWDFKRFCYDLTESLNFVQQIPTIEAESYNWSMVKLYEQMQQPGAVSVTNEKCFRFIHMTGAHVPFTYDKNLQPISTDVSTYYDPVAACVTFADSYIQLLKDAGVYDNTIIVFMGDHGYDYTNMHLLNRFHPVLMVKGINETGEEMTFDETPVSYENVAQALMKLLDQVPSGDIFDEYVSDTRRLICYTYTKEHLMTEYTTAGHASDFDAKKFTGVEFTREPY